MVWRGHLKGHRRWGTGLPDALRAHNSSQLSLQTASGQKGEGSSAQRKASAVTTGRQGRAPTATAAPRGRHRTLLSSSPHAGPAHAPPPRRKAQSRQSPRTLTRTHTCLHALTHAHMQSHTHTHMQSRTHKHTHSHTQTYSRTHTHSHAITCAHMHVLTHTHILKRTHIYTFMHSYALTRTHVLAHTHVHSCALTRTHTYLHTLVHSHIHTHTRTAVRLPMLRQTTAKNMEPTSALDSPQTPGSGRPDTSLGRTQSANGLCPHSDGSGCPTRLGTASQGPGLVSAAARHGGFVLTRAS